jgi:hypothetical protein
LVHAHAGALDAERANSVAREFAIGPTYDVIKGTKPHRQFELSVSKPMT